MVDLILGAARLVVGLLVLLFALYVPGAVTLHAFALRRAGRHIFAGVTEWLFMAVAVSVLVTGMLGFLLAELGWFHWWTVLVAVVAYAAAAGFAAGVPARRGSIVQLVRLPQPYPLRAADARLARMQRYAFFLLILVACVLFSRPAEMLRGALDSGVYINDGVALARSGSIFQHDIVMRQLNDDAGEGRELLQGLNPDRYVLARNRMPGFYVYDKQAALVVPQHYFLYPVWIGLMDSLFGIWGALYTTPLLALLFVIAVYFFARRALSGGTALLAMALLIVCPVTVWFARYPVSEVITGLLLFVGFYAFIRMVYLLRGRDRPTVEHADEPVEQDIASTDTPAEGWASFFGVVSALALGEIMLARPDFLFYLAPVPVYLLYWRLSRTWQRPHTWFAGTFAILLAVFALHYSIYSYPYTLDLYHNVIIDVRRLWGPLLFLVYFGTTALVLLDRLYPRVRPFWARLARLAVRYRWVWAGVIVVLVAGYVIYQYGAGPWIPNDRRDRAGNPLPQLYPTTFASYIGAQTDQGSRYNLLRVGWYLSPFGLVLGVLGLLRWIWTRLDAATALFFGSLLITGFVFVQQTFTDATYIYTMRRYEPLVLPALILGFAWACHFAWTRLRPRALGTVVATALSLVLALFFVYTGRTIYAHVEEQGAVSQLTSLADHFPGKSIVLFSNERDEPYVVATPLQYVFGVESFVLTHSYPDVNNKALAGAVGRWRKQGYQVFAVLGANGGKLDLPGYQLKPQGSWTYDVPELEQLYYQKPYNVSRATLPWGIYSVEPAGVAAPPTLPYTVDIGDMDYNALVAGFYVQEKTAGDNSYWRWTGDHAILRLPWTTKVDGTLSGATLKLRLRPESPAAGKPVQRKEPLTVKIQVEGQQVGEVTVPPGTQFADYTVKVPAGIKSAEGEKGTAFVHIVAPTWSPLSAGVSDDPRALGVQVDSVEVSNP